MGSKYFSKNINYSSATEYLRYGYVSDSLSILENTYKLSPGKILKYDMSKKIKIDKYWDTYSEFLNMRKAFLKGHIIMQKKKSLIK